MMNASVRRAGVREEKLVLRQAIVAARDAVGAESRAIASHAITARIAALDAFVHAGAVLAILPYRSEWDATLVVRAALASGKIVAAPRVDPAARMLRALRLASIDDDVEAGFRGIPEPRAHCEEIALDRVEGYIDPVVS
jgi:5-formyltetrahydrofolate cyclo-ligase